MHPTPRFGFAVKVLGQPGLKSEDSRRWQSNPHLRVSLGYLRELFAYLRTQDITMYRMSSDLAPYLTHPDLPQFHQQIAECADDLRDLGAAARAQGLRLSFHPSQYIVLNALNPKLLAQSITDVQSQATMLDLMGMGPEAVVVIHVGGVYGDKPSALHRWGDVYLHQLPEPARRRLVLENDDVSFSAADVLQVHDRTGVPLIFDHQHFHCNNPERLDLIPTAKRFLDSWPTGVRPKMHFSSPRTELRSLKRKAKGGRRKQETVLVPPIWTGHADYADPFSFSGFVRELLAAGGRHFDVMLEAKAKDLALRRLRADLPRYAPDLAGHFGLLDRELAPETDEIVLADPPALTLKHATATPTAGERPPTEPRPKKKAPAKAKVSPPAATAATTRKRRPAKAEGA